ncbi:zinc finger BED domain-containing protein 4-like [Astyanax mexicanus]|uniref:zinc finger BED domain-containing protein 4-like n=1 Tax=Astyanax mexicanus TaxID=7994 RepID=UPI0020CA9E7C|nr:zinc finger BED domain-containing protein 4-like [Astyanax mexicanus]
MSAVWRFFRVSEQDIKHAVCNTCSANVLRGGSKVRNFNTTNLITHLKAHHPDKYTEYMTVKEETRTAPRTPAKPAASQPIDELLQKSKKFDRNSPKATAITAKVMEFIALDDQPFSVVEDIGFRRLVEHLEPRYTIPSRRYFSDVALPELHSLVETRVHKLINDNVTGISLTTDIWTSDVSPVSILSLTAQWIDNNFELQKAVLHAKECSGSHTSSALSMAFENMFETWKISKENIHVVLRDNARNIAKAMVECGVPSLPCMAHTLQLAVHDGVFSQRSISDVVALSRRIVGHFKHSHLASSRLKTIQTEVGLQPKVLQQDVSTRWNSTFYMLQTLLEQKRAIGAYAADFELPATLTASQWSLIENIVTLLAPFEQLTREICQADALASNVIPSVNALKRLLSKSARSDFGVKTSKNALLEAVNTRFSDIYTEPLYCVATMVDPRYKDRYFAAEVKLQAQEMLQTEMEKASSERSEQTSELQERPREKRARTDDQATCSLFDMYDEILEETLTPQENTQTTTEVQGFLSEAPVARTESPLQYWNNNKSRFPTIAKVAKKFLSAPSTSVDSERLFSATSNVINEKRNRIACDKAEMLLLVKKNLPLLLKNTD